MWAGTFCAGSTSAVSAWLPLLRTNTNDLHPLWFAVYGHHVYHHGAGFRPRQSRVEAYATERESVPKPTSTTLEGFMIKAIRQPSLVARLRPRHLGELPLAARMSVVKQQRRRELKRREREFSGPGPGRAGHLRASAVGYRSSTASSTRRPWRNRGGRRSAGRRGGVEEFVQEGNNLTANGAMRGW